MAEMRPIIPLACWRCKAKAAVAALYGPRLNGREMHWGNYCAECAPLAQAERENDDAARFEAPKRIQLSLKKGWRMPDNTVKVDRTTKWGNPFVAGFVAGKEAALAGGRKVQDRRHAFVLYRSLAFDNAALVEAAQAELRGKNLACWCPQDDPYEDNCHAAVLLQIANAPLAPKGGATP